MIALKTRTIFARTLLVAAVVCLVSATLCSTRAVVVQSVNKDVEEEGVACCQAQSSPDTASPQGERREGGCGCKAFKVFPANPVTMPRVPAPAFGFARYDLCRDEFMFESATVAVTSRNTGPPGCLSPAELILQGRAFQPRSATEGLKATPRLV